MLDGKTRKYLRGCAHDMKPVVQIGKTGISDAVVAEIERSAAALELLKIKLLPTAGSEPAELQEALAGRLSGEIIGRVGRTLIYFLPPADGSRYLRRLKPASSRPAEN